MHPQALPRDNESMNSPSEPRVPFTDVIVHGLAQSRVSRLYHSVANCSCTGRLFDSPHSAKFEKGNVLKFTRPKAEFKFTHCLLFEKIILCHLHVESH